MARSQAPVTADLTSAGTARFSHAPRCASTEGLAVVLGLVGPLGATVAVTSGQSVGAGDAEGVADPAVIRIAVGAASALPEFRRRLQLAPAAPTVRPWLTA
ncbi:hypothetical protein [Streptomyces sp. NPDC058486]|uniref:hypothetical protein n=1 Tax=unclassified Streptomyces TaxID=2593676 RepID=UPI003647DE1D